MSRIVPDIDTLELHEKLRHADPERYRPDHCPSCDYAVLWGHGCYERQPDRGIESGGQFNPTLILRFYCPGCGRTCSRLPQCIPPRRWYLWLVQQWVLQALLAGESLNSVSRRFFPCRRTIKRWLSWITECSALFRFHLSTHFPHWEKQRHVDGYWLASWKHATLSTQMLTLARSGVVVP